MINIESVLYVYWEFPVLDKGNPNKYVNLKK